MVLMVHDMVWSVMLIISIGNFIYCTVELFK